MIPRAQEPPLRSALLCIDLQVLGCRREHCSPTHHGMPGDADRDQMDSYLERLEAVVLPNVRALQRCFRESGREVVHTRIRSLTRDGRDRSLEHKRLGIHAAPGSEQAEFLAEVAPEDDEVVIDKTASGVFVSTNLDYVLRNLEISRLFVSGVYTNECVSSAVRSASDLGFEVVLISDATAAITPELHEATLLIADGRYAKVAKTREVLARF